MNLSEKCFRATLENGSKIYFSLDDIPMKISDNCIILLKYESSKIIPIASIGIHLFDNYYSGDVVIVKVNNRLKKCYLFYDGEIKVKDFSGDGVYDITEVVIIKSCNLTINSKIKNKFNSNIAWCDEYGWFDINYKYHINNKDIKIELINGGNYVCFTQFNGERS